MKDQASIRGLVVLSAIFVLADALSVFGLTLSLGSAYPVPGLCDIYNFAGANLDMFNVYAAGNAPATNGAANDGYTYVADDRATQGQTFTTGSSSGGYRLTDVWVRHAGYTDNTIDPDTPGSNGTWNEMAGGGGLTLRITNPSLAGTSGFVLHSETYATTGSEGWPVSATGSLNGDGEWLHFTLATPVALAANTSYGFDLTSVTNNNAFFEWLGNSTNVFSGGTAYNGSTAGTPDNTLNPLVGSRVFLVRLMPLAQPKLAAGAATGAQVQLSWAGTNTGYLLQTGTNLTGPWNYSGLGVSTVNDTNFSTDSTGNSLAFYRLQYLTGAQPIPVLSWQTNAVGVMFQMNPGTLLLQVFSPGVVRVVYSLTNTPPTNSFAVIASPTNSGWNLVQTTDDVRLSTSLLQVRVSRGTGAVGFYDTNGAEILTEWPAGGRSLIPVTIGVPTSDGGVNTLQSRSNF